MLISVCHSEMGEATGIFTLKAQPVPLVPTIFGADKSHAKELSDSFVLFFVETGYIAHFQEDFKPISIEGR